MENVLVKQSLKLLFQILYFNDRNNLKNNLESTYVIWADFSNSENFYHKENYVLVFL